MRYCRRDASDKRKPPRRSRSIRDATVFRARADSLGELGRMVFQ